MLTYVVSCRSDKVITPWWMFFYRGYSLGIYGFLISGNDFDEVMKRAEEKARVYFPAKEGWNEPIVSLDEVDNN